jgi:hypothetical protein
MKSQDSKPWLLEEFKRAAKREELRVKARGLQWLLGAVLLALKAQISLFCEHPEKLSL